MNKLNTLTMGGNTYDSFPDQEAVKLVPQTLTEVQKAQARENIGAADADSIDALNSVVMASQSPKITMFNCKGVSGDSLDIIADEDCKVTSVSKNLFYSDYTMTQGGVTRTAKGNIIRFNGISTWESGTLNADMPVYIPAGKIYVQLQTNAVINDVSFRNQERNNPVWVASNPVNGNVYEAELSEPAYWVRSTIPMSIREFTDSDTIAIYVGYEPLASGEEIPDAHLAELNAFANERATIPCYEDGYIFSDGAEFSVFVTGKPRRNLDEINNEIDALKTQMPIFMSVSDFNKAADMVNNESTVILLS